MTFLLDELWALSPFLLAPQIGVGLALAATAALIYVPFAQRTLLLMGDRSQAADLCDTLWQLHEQATEIPIGRSRESSPRSRLRWSADLRRARSAELTYKPAHEQQAARIEMSSIAKVEADKRTAVSAKREPPRSLQVNLLVPHEIVQHCRLYCEAGCPQIMAGRGRSALRESASWTTTPMAPTKANFAGRGMLERQRKDCKLHLDVPPFMKFFPRDRASQCAESLRR